MDLNHHVDNTFDPIVADTVRPAQVISWILDCEENHGDRCNIAEHWQAAPVTELKCVDVVNECIVHIPADVRYFALSYMWGGVEQMLLTMENVAELSQPKSLQCYWSKIPSVIQDAIHFVAALGERYLWVDSLCIVQNDAKMKHHQIAQMGAIYNGAIASLVGAAGTDANYGLAGVRPGTRIPETKRPQYEQPYLIDPGPDQYISLRRPRDNSPYIKLERRVRVRQLDLYDQLISSNYNSRAWTYQERLLSRRCIYFMKNMIYFNCRSAIRGENKAAPYSTSTKDIRPFSLFISDPIFSDPLRYQRTLGAVYATVVAEFTRKSLSFPLDVLDAFSGIGSAMEKFCSWKLIAGMPESILEYALLWEASGSFQRRNHYADNVFPSWSWAGWYSEVDYDSIFRLENEFEPYLAEMESLIYGLCIRDHDGLRSINSLVPGNEEMSIVRLSLGKETLGWLSRVKVGHLPKNTLIFQAYTIPFCRYFLLPGSRAKTLDPIITLPGLPTTRRIGVEYLLPGQDWDVPLILNYDFGKGPPLDGASDHDVVFLSMTQELGREVFGVTSCLLVKWTGSVAERVAIGKCRMRILFFKDEFCNRDPQMNWAYDGLGKVFGLEGRWKTIQLI